MDELSFGPIPFMPPLKLICLAIFVISFKWCLGIFRKSQKVFVVLPTLISKRVKHSIAVELYSH